MRRASFVRIATRGKAVVRMLRPFGYHVIPTVAIIAGLSLGLASCYSHGVTTCGQEDSATSALRGSVMVKYGADEMPPNGETVKPGAGSLVFVELCDLYSENPDPSKAHPNYRYSALVDDAGQFSVDVPKGRVGLHTLLEGYLYGSKLTTDSTASGIVVTAEALNGRPAPTAKDFAFTPTDPTEGSELRFTLTVQSAANDPLSEEILLAEPVSGLARAFAPPRRGQPGKGFPDGQWSATLTAPAPGSYTYYAQAVSEGCAVSERLSVQVTVR